jgi:membrane protein YqaA with SNARE-associated domain
VIKLSLSWHFNKRGFIKLYLTLFLSSFLAATIFPAQSETLLAYQISQHPNSAVTLLCIATFGNVLGALVNWILGRFASNASRWFQVKEERLTRAKNFYFKYGRYSLLLSWVPIIGDPITIVAGIMQEQLFTFLVLVTIGKLTRYLFVAGLISFFI